MKRVQTLRGATLASAFVCVLAALIFGASCRSAVGLEDEYQDSVDAFCAFLERCPVDFADCPGHIRPGFEGGSSDLWAGWIASFGEKQCLEGCRSARGCLDVFPACGTKQCTTKEDCCGFTTGRAQCDLKSGQCCKPAGVECNDTSECCDGAGPCSPTFGTCGGVRCKTVGDACVNPFDCCTKVCLDGACAPEICGEVGFECKVDKECCPDLVCDIAPGSPLGLCKQPNCKLLGALCDDANPCCPVPGETVSCQALPPETVSFCTTCNDGRLPNGVDCGADSQCCSGYCDTNFFLCGEPCAKQGESCTSATDCCDGVCDNGTCNVACPSTCTTNTDCCSGECVGQLCKPVCTPPSTCKHGVCFAGGPLSKDCAPQCVGPGCPASASCVEQICLADSYCCCTSWDSLCVAHAFDVVSFPACAGCGP